MVLYLAIDTLVTERKSFASSPLLEWTVHAEPAVLEFMVISPALTPECWNCGRECLNLVGIASGKSEFDCSLLASLSY